MKKIIVIGASSGIGMRIATDFVRAGWKVGIAALWNAIPNCLWPYLKFKLSTGHNQKAQHCLRIALFGLGLN